MAGSKDKDQESIKKCKKMVARIGIRTEQVQAYEDCERISDIICDDIVELIDDADLQDTIKKMRRLHAEIRAEHAAPFIKKAKELYGRLPDSKSVLTYHQVEQLLEKVDDAAIAGEEPEMRDLLGAIKHVHDKGHAARKAEIFGEIMS